MMNANNDPPPANTAGTTGAASTTAPSTKATDASKTTTAAAAAQSKKTKEKPANLVIPPKKAPLTKAERRAIQEAQRAAKAGGGAPAKPAPKDAKPAAAAAVSVDATKPSAVDKKSTAPTTSTSGTQQQQQQATTSASSSSSLDQSNKTMTLFSHLPPYRDAQALEDELLYSPGNPLFSTLHPAVIQLGRDYASGAIRGGNARCRAMLQCFAQVLSDYQPPSNNNNDNNTSNSNSNNNNNAMDLRQQLEQDVLKPSFDFWTNHCRPHSVSMGNAFTFFKTAVATLDREWSWETMRHVLVQDTIPAYLTQRLEYSDTAIAHYAVSKLQPTHEVILTFGYSQVIQEVLETAWRQEGKQFRVICVDSRPLLEGRRMLHALRRAGLEDCTYILYHSLTYVMPTVTKVLLGASALMSNGSVLGRIGTAGIALAAKAHQVPVLVCCESYKISNRVQLESITHNELGPAFSLWQGAAAAAAAAADSDANKNNSSNSNSLQVLNLMYDLTHSELVSGVITEMGILPPTSVAVLLREMNPMNN